MSRQPSPGPSIPHMHQPNPLSMYHPPGVANDPRFIQKHRNKTVAGITAGVEDVKYQAKYKDLKKKVKEIEMDNDRLLFKLLAAKKNIRRMNLERAILYERLAAVPPTPGRHVQDLPPEQDPIFNHQPPLPPEHVRVIDTSDPALSEYLSGRSQARVVHGPDGRVVAVEDIPPNAPGGAPSQPPPHGLPLVYGFRHDSGPGYDPNRQLPPLPPMIPLLQPLGEHTQDFAPINDHHGAPYPQVQPHGHGHAYVQSHGGSTHHSRSNSTRPDLDALPGSSTRIDSLPSTHAGHSRSPGVPGEPHAERSRRHDAAEPAHLHGHPHPHPHPHVQIPTQNLSSSPPAYSPASTRSSERSGGRVHNHQRVGPGANINRDVVAREWEAEQAWNREREREHAHAHRLRHEMRAEWAHDEREQAGPGVSHSASRSASPPSAPGNGGSRVPSRPASRQAYDAERVRPRPSRAPGPIGAERESAFDEPDDRVPAMRGPSAEMPAAGLGPVDGADEMDADEYPNEGGGIARAPSSHNSALPRGTKRRRSEDGDEEPDADERMEEDD
ncbi:predicted protein [Postia placenta Mad-698-R]|nr:predicted protein [Postia placenta Mad-698-R]